MLNMGLTGFGGGAVTPRAPQRAALTFPKSGGDSFIYLASGDVPSFNREKYSLFWNFKHATITSSGIRALGGYIDVGGSAANTTWQVYINGNTWNFIVYNTAGTSFTKSFNPSLPMDDYGFHTILVNVDWANGTAANRLRVWLDRAELTLSGTDLTGNGATTATQIMYLGETGTGGGNGWSGHIAQFALGSNVLWAPDDVTDNVGSQYKDLTGLSSAVILYQPTDTGGVLHDLVLPDGEWQSGGAGTAVSLTTSTVPAMNPDVPMDNHFQITQYTGTGAQQDITTGLQQNVMDTLLWIKNLTNAQSHYIANSGAGSGGYYLSSDTQAVLTGDSAAVNNPNSAIADGFRCSGSSALVNANGDSYIAAQFYVTPGLFWSEYRPYTGNGTNKTVPHRLGSVPGCIIVKDEDTASTDWYVYHRSLNGGTTPHAYYLKLNTTAAEVNSTTFWNNTAPTKDVFSVGGAAASPNTNAKGYFAMAFGHEDDADGKCYCGGFSTNGSGAATIVLPFQPQFVIMKRRDGVGDWIWLDTTRGWTAGSDSVLLANTNAAPTSADRGAPSGTGFTVAGLTASAAYIFIAIRA